MTFLYKVKPLSLIQRSNKFKILDPENDQCNWIDRKFIAIFVFYLFYLDWWFYD